MQSHHVRLQSNLSNRTVMQWHSTSPDHMYLFNKQKDPAQAASGTPAVADAAEGAAALLNPPRSASPQGGGVLLYVLWSPLLCI